MHRLVNPGQDAHWNTRRSYRDPRHVAAEAFAAPKIEWFRRVLGIAPDASVLDVGAGSGMFTWWWAQQVRDVRGLELSATMIERSPCAELMEPGDAYALPYPDDAFDVVFAGNLLHHLERPELALAEMGRVSRGPVAVVEPNRNHAPMAAFGAVSSACRGLLHYSRSTLDRLARRAGLEVAEVSLHGFVYENRSPTASLPVARVLERKLPGGAYVLLAARAA